MEVWNYIGIKWGGGKQKQKNVHHFNIATLYAEMFFFLISLVFRIFPPSEKITKSHIEPKLH